MQLSHALISCYILISAVGRSSASSVNKVKLSSCAVWNTSGAIMANTATNASSSFNAFIGVSNTLYVVDQTKKEIQVWPQPNNTLTFKMANNITFPLNIFVTITGDVFTDNGLRSYVSRFPRASISSVIIMYINRGCNSLFVDVTQMLYCSVNDGHLVMKTPLDGKHTTLIVAAGTGCAGSAAHMLNQSLGIYVDTNSYLYVADTGNDRIQRFDRGNLTGTTVAGGTARVSLTLNKPTSVVLDGDDRLYIVDSGNQRIVRVGPEGSECLIGCSSQSCNSPDQLCDPLTAMFDTFGNIFVVNQNKNGIQKFLLATNSCETTTTTSSTVESTITSPMQTTITSTVQTTTTSTAVIDQSCVPPNITLFPGPSSFDKPLQFRRSQDFYISVMLRLKCASSLQVSTKWTIFNCTLNCLIPAVIGSSVTTTGSELAIPAKVLTYGLYEMKLAATMTSNSHVTSSESAYVRINPTGITANLVPYGTSMITSGQEQDLTLDPGTHSVNPDEDRFNASDWTYSYQCRVYDATKMGAWSEISETNHSCFSNRRDNRPAWTSNGPDVSLSSITILAGSLTFHHTYQFTVHLINIRNATLQAYGFFVSPSRKHASTNGGCRVSRYAFDQGFITISRCVISSMCAPNQQYQFINPSTQVALFSECVGKCGSLLSMSWTVYDGKNDSTTGLVGWSPFDHRAPSQNLHFFGMDRSNFTAINTLFLSNRHIIYWRFEVLYSFPTETSMSALNFLINQPPQNGSCSIYPPNGTISTLFTISCTGWSDDDDIQDYSVYLQGSSVDATEQIMLAFTIKEILQLRLPTGTGPRSTLNLTVQIRDRRNCANETQLGPVVVTPDQAVIDALIDMVRNPNDKNSSNIVVEALSSGNQNLVGQVVTSLSQEFNKNNKQNLESAITDGIDPASISVSPLGGKRSAEPSKSANGSINDGYIQNLNTYASIRDYLMEATTNLVILRNIDSIKLLATSLAQLTQSTNELTRTSSLMAATKCHQLAVELRKKANTTSYEDARFASIQIAHCINNVLTAINAPLQQRGVFLNADSADDDTASKDYDADFEVNQLALDATNDDGASRKKAMRNMRLFEDQKKTANEIAGLAVLTFTLLSFVLNIHLNVDQELTVNSPSLLIALETIAIESLQNKLIRQVENAYIRIPSSFQHGLPKEAAVSLRATVQPLAPMGASSLHPNLNVSTAISLTVFDRDSREISIKASEQQPIEFFIPRDPNLSVPAMRTQNMTSTSHFHLIDMTDYVMNSNLTVSLHFEIRSVDANLTYLLIYQFDRRFAVTENHEQWSVLCPSNFTNESVYTYFINNRRTAGHKSIVFRFKELNVTDFREPCQSAAHFDESENLSSKYELRVYASGCYYLDEYNNWQSNGLWVGPLTDHYRTHCFSTHLTTFASSFLVLPVSNSENLFHLVKRNQFRFPSNVALAKRRLESAGGMNFVVDENDPLRARKRISTEL